MPVGEVVMGLSHSPKIVTDGLVYCFDSNNIKSYKGPAVQNLATAINGNNHTGSGLSITSSTETVTIPSLGQLTSVVMSGYNNYPAVSTLCCPAPFSFVLNDGYVSCSPSTQYTYSIV